MLSSANAAESINSPVGHVGLASYVCAERRALEAANALLMWCALLEVHGPSLAAVPPQRCLLLPLPSQSGTRKGEVLRTTDRRGPTTQSVGRLPLDR